MQATLRKLNTQMRLARLAMRHPATAKRLPLAFWCIYPLAHAMGALGLVVFYAVVLPFGFASGFLLALAMRLGIAQQQGGRP